MRHVYRKSASICSKYIGYDEPDCEEILHAIFRLPVEVLWEVGNRKNLSSKRRLLIIRVVKLGILAFRRHGACKQRLGVAACVCTMWRITRPIWIPLETYRPLIEAPK